MPPMETLGLSGPPTRRDNFIKRLFWPADEASDADMLGQQGFWLCLIVAVLSLVVFTLQGQWIIGLLAAVFFFVGGIGVREHSMVAAICVAAFYIINLIGSMLLGQFPGFLTFFASASLLGNIRGCWIASKWARVEPESMPLRLNETWQDKLVDQMPAKVWPKAKILFYVLACLNFALTIVGMVMMFLHRHQG